MYQFRFVHVTQCGSDFGAGLAHDAAGFVGAVVDQATCDVAPALVDAADHLAALELAADFSHANRQQAFALSDQGLHRARIEHQSASDLQVVGQPLAAGGQRQLAGGELAADHLACGQSLQYFVLAPAGDDGVGATARGPLRGQDLGQHAAGADAGACAASHIFQLRIARRGLMDEFGIGMLARIGAVQAGLVGQDDQGVSFDQIGDQRAQGVIVADLDLVGGDRVVFVDDRDDLQLQQGAQGAAGVQVTLPISQVGMGEQDLGGVQAVAPKTAFIGLDQAHLANRGGGLQLVQRGRSFRPAQTIDALGDGAAGDQHYFLVLLDQGRDLFSPAGQAGMIQAAAVVGDQAAADLDHDALGEGDDGLAHSCSAVRFISSRCSWMA